MLKLFTKENEFSEKFESLVLRFTDSTYDDLKKGGGVGASGVPVLIYLELANRKTVPAGRAKRNGNTSVERNLS